MSSNRFTKDNLDLYLKELAKEYKKLGGKYAPAEIVLVGGAAILSGYGFRDMTTDVDAIIHAESSMKEAIKHVGEKFDLPMNWLNAAFKRTTSYSPKLDEISVYYKSFYGVLTVRTVADEYLIAMKLRAGRKYKHDLSDVVGILAENEQKGTPINFTSIQSAVEYLYGSWNVIDEDIRGFVQQAVLEDNLQSIFASVSEEEENSKHLMIAFEKKYENVVNASNVDEILKNLKERQQ